MVIELEHLTQMLRTAFRHKDASQRAVAGVFAFGVALILLAALGLQLFVTFKAMPEQAALGRAQSEENRATYAWIAQHLPPDASLLSNDDPLLYLYTGHQGNLAPLMPRWWYAGDHSQNIGFFKDVAAYCRTRGFEYILATHSDVSRWTDEQDAAFVEKAMQENPLLERLYQSKSGVTVYHVKSLITHTAAHAADPSAKPE